MPPKFAILSQVIQNQTLKLCFPFFLLSVVRRLLIEDYGNHWFKSQLASPSVWNFQELALLSITIGFASIARALLEHGVGKTDEGNDCDISNTRAREERLE